MERNRDCQQQFGIVDFQRVAAGLSIAVRQLICNALSQTFNAVSAFCNAGFDITGCVDPGANMLVFNQDPVVMITLMLLVVIGGLGFFVWEEVVRVRSFKKFSVYTKLVNKIKNASPDTKIILQSIYPVARNWEKTKSINNERIRAANGWVQQVAEDCGIYYLDTISVLADEEGYLPEAYQNGDGIHLNANSCGIVLDYIRTHALPGYTEE